MNAELETARGDLAYMRSLIGGTERMQKTMGEAFFWAGLLYGAQCGLHALQVAGMAPEQGLPALLIAWLPTVIFCAVLAVIIWKDRKAPTGGPSSRALSTVFQGAGLANLVMAFVFAYGAEKFETPGLWLYQPVVVCMFQGVAWYTAWAVLQRVWLGFVAAGWFATTVGLGVVIGDTGAYLLILSAALIALMAIPGWVMWRGAKRTG
ncbi:MAG: hypothetical protein H7124_06130 [Phycisphaerales bacterium]|nr:hypothetical protein [Hyphomonadaceae bacterium]